MRNFDNINYIEAEFKVWGELINKSASIVKESCVVLISKNIRKVVNQKKAYFKVLKYFYNRLEERFVDTYDVGEIGKTENETIDFMRKKVAEVSVEEEIGED